MQRKLTTRPHCVSLDPRTAAEVSDINRRLDSLQRVMAALIGRRNILLRTGRAPKPTTKPKPSQGTLFE